jgi:hypothetical protein
MSFSTFEFNRRTICYMNKKLLLILFIALDFYVSGNSQPKINPKHRMLPATNFYAVY